MMSQSAKEYSAVPHNREHQPPLADLGPDIHPSFSRDDIPCNIITKVTKFLQKFNDLQVQTYTHINTLPGPGRANEFKVVIINLNRYLEEADQDRILLSDSITDISTVISDGKYMSWYCYTLLEEIISKYGDPYLKREMIDYTKLLHHFEANSRMSQIKGLILSQMRSNCLLLKVPCYHEHQMMADIRRYRNNYAHRIGVPESSIHPYSVLGTSPPAIYFIVPVVLLPRVFLPQSSFDRLNALLSQQLEDRVIHNLSIEEADQLINGDGSEYSSPTDNHHYQSIEEPVTCAHEQESPYDCSERSNFVSGNIPLRTTNFCHSDYTKPEDTHRGCNY